MLKSFVMVDHDFFNFKFGGGNLLRDKPDYHLDKKIKKLIKSKKEILFNDLGEKIWISKKELLLYSKYYSSENCWGWIISKKGWWFYKNKETKDLVMLGDKISKSLNKIKAKIEKQQAKINEKNFCERVDKMAVGVKNNGY